MSVQVGTRKVVKVIELVGVSPDSWSDAAKNAVAEASRTVHGITGVEVLHSSALVEGGQIKEYHVNMKVAFVVERG
ncbi:MAG TPA: dodecin family protein [Candidatus Dormibacteraeota bacterium]|nr:dodecin family protein [Candidatus Dormibacteraeota bacterium]